MASAPSDGLVGTMKRAAAALRATGRPFALAGGMAIWARGGPTSEHDVDFVVREDDVDAAVSALDAAGFRTERAPEGWLAKAWDGDVLVDLIFALKGIPVDDELFARCDRMDVAATSLLVLPATDVLTSRLLALDEHQLDYTAVVSWGRSLREQVDWAALTRRTAESPLAGAYFVILRGLGIDDADAAARAAVGVKEAVR